MSGLIFTAIFFPLVGLAVNRIFGGRGSAIPAGLGAVGFVQFVTGVWHVPMIVPMAILGIASLVLLIFHLKAFNVGLFEFEQGQPQHHGDFSREEFFRFWKVR